MLEARDLRFAYKQGTSEFEFPDILCDRGEQWLLLGQSGSGKTTLLHLLGGLRKLDSGKIVIDGQNITTMPEARLDRFRGRNIGIIFQQAHFVRSLTVRENLRLGQTLAGLPADDNRINIILDRLGIRQKADVSPRQLSIGEQQRASICRALINRPKLILADEPTSALDDYHCNEVINLLREQAAAEQITLLIVTHDNRLKTVFDKSIQLKQQQLV